MHMLHMHVCMCMCMCMCMLHVHVPRLQPYVQAGFPTAIAALASLEAFNMGSGDRLPPPAAPLALTLAPPPAAPPAAPPPARAATLRPGSSSRGAGGAAAGAAEGAARGVPHSNHYYGSVHRQAGSASLRQTDSAYNHFCKEQRPLLPPALQLVRAPSWQCPRSGGCVSSGQHLAAMADYGASHGACHGQLWPAMALPPRGVGGWWGGGTAPAARVHCL